MTDIVLHDIDPVLLERIGRVAKARGWGLQEGLMHLLEHGLFTLESELAARFNDSDAMALQAAISALEGIPSDPGFALIGRVERGAAPPQPEPAPAPPSITVSQFDLDLLAFTSTGDQPAG